MLHINRKLGRNNIINSIEVFPFNMQLEANIALLYKKRRNSNTATSIYFFGQMMTNPDTYFLKSRRLGFRTWKKDDLDLALGLWGDHEVTKLFDARGALSKNQVKERLFHEIASEKQSGVQYWPVFLLGNGDHIGACGLKPYDTEKNIFEIGFHIRSIHWGKGYATEAARAVMKYAFESIKVSTLFAGHNPKNKTSKHLLIKLGFSYIHDEFYEPTGLMHPSYFLTAADARL